MTDEKAPLVLYVEDNPAVLELGVTALEEGGFRVESVRSGADAICALESSDAPFRALVTDIDIPAPDGWDVARRARELFPDLAVIYVSGGSSHEWASKGRARQRHAGETLCARPTGRRRFQWDIGTFERHLHEHLREFVVA